MLKIRLQRVGRKHEPSFRLVLTDSKNSSKSGRFGELLGSYDPRKSIEALKADRIKHWISMGAGLTPTINNLLIRKGIIRGKKVDVSAGSAPVIEATPVAEAAPMPEVMTEEAVPEVVEEVPTPEAAPMVEETPVVEVTETVPEEALVPEVVESVKIEDVPAE